MTGFGAASFGTTPWGVTSVVTGVDPSVVSDEGGTILALKGSFKPNTVAYVTINGVACSLPVKLGGIRNDKNTFSHPKANIEGNEIKCIVPPLEPGVYSITVSQPGTTDVVGTDLLTVVRRDYWTRLHSLRSMFPVPGFNDIGAKTIDNEALSGASEVSGVRGALFAIAEALLEGDGVVYTRLVKPYWKSGSNVTVSSTDAGDTTQHITVYGTDTNGIERTETLLLNGTASVAGSIAWSSIQRCVLDSACAGDVGVRDTAAPVDLLVIPASWREKVYGEVLPGDRRLFVEGCFRFPDSGTVALPKETKEYSVKYVSPTINYIEVDSAIEESYKPGEIVADWTRDRTAVDLARSALIPAKAEGYQLDTATLRWGGVRRPPTLSDDETWRRVHAAIAYAPRGSLAALRAFFDAAVGAGNYEIIEDLVTYLEDVDSNGFPVYTDSPQNTGWPCVVWVTWESLANGSDATGKTYLSNWGEATASSTTEITTSEDIVSISGIYGPSDVSRSVNLIHLKGIGDGSTGGTNQTILSSGSLFKPSFDGQDIEIYSSADETEHGIFVFNYVSSSEGTLSVKWRNDGYVDNGALDKLSITSRIPYGSCVFAPRDKGKQVAVVIGGVTYTRTIIDVEDARTVVLDTTLPTGGDDLSWGFYPYLHAGSTFSWKTDDYSLSGKTITLGSSRLVAGTDYAIDYTILKSGIVFIDAEVENTYPNFVFPFYLSGDGLWILDLLRDLTVAGVQLRNGDPHK